MKTQYSRRANTANWQLVIGGVLVLVVVVMLGIRFLFPSTFSAITLPLWSVGTDATTLATMGDTVSRAAYEQVVNERDALLLELHALESMLSDIERLPGTDGIVGFVRARPPLAPYDVLVVDRGRDSGVEIDAQVYAPGGVPIGVVHDASATESRVTLYSHRGYTTLGWVGEERFPVSFVGEGAGGFTARVPRETDIIPGDIAYLSGPGALPFAVVANVVGDASSPQIRLELRPYVSPFSITTVLIETL